ncbi:MAG: 30S ribosomal protein S2 [Candidatus Omnitrophota bacterium]
MSLELIKQFLEAGVHFGHKTSRWNPKMQKFIFGKRSGIYIIDLEKTALALEKAREFVREITARGDSVLFVGTKKQAQGVVYEEALRCGMYYVTERWPGGLLTNFSTIKKRIARLKEIERMQEDGTFQKLTKKEVARLEKELAKLKRNFGGIVQMEGMPAAVFIVDTKKEATAVDEARRLGVPIIGIIDTNGNPDIIDYPIAGNDDATKSVRLITSLIADTVIEGRKKFLSYLSESGVALKPKEEEDMTILPQEEAKTEEAEGTVEKETEPEGEGPKHPRKKAHPKHATE